jgi:hypothetical protein
MKEAAHSPVARRKVEQPPLLKHLVHEPTYMNCMKAKAAFTALFTVLCTLRMKEAGTLLYHMIRGADALYEGSSPLCCNLYGSGAYLMYEGSSSPPPVH